MMREQWCSDAANQPSDAGSSDAQASVCTVQSGEVQLWTWSLVVREISMAACNCSSDTNANKDSDYCRRTAACVLAEARQHSQAKAPQNQGQGKGR